MSKAVMTVHGFLTDIKDFGRLYDYLDFYDEVVPCKVPGHNDGESFDKFTVDSTISCILKCFDELAAKHETVDVVGFSMGGALTSYLCARRAVNKAVMISPSNKYFNLSSPLAMIKFYFNYIVQWLKQRDARSTNNEELRRALQNSMVSAGIAIKRIFPSVDLHTFNVFADLMDLVCKVVDECAPIGVNSLLLWGELDELVPKASVEYLQNKFLNLQTVILPDVGHGMLYTNRDNKIIEQVVSFLSDGKQVVSVPFQDKTV